MKRMAKMCLCLLLAAMLLLSGAAAESGNVTIAVQGQDGFNDYISSMFVWDGRLLLASWQKMYVWQPGSEGLTEVEGYEALETVLYESRTESEDGETVTYTVGSTEIELEAGAGISLYSDVISMGDKLYRRASVYGEEGEARSLFIELVIDENGVPSLGDAIDLEDALTIEYGDGYTGMREIQNPCYYDGRLYCLSYGEDGRELLEIDLEDADVDALSIDAEGEIQSISAFTEGKLLLVELNYNVDPMETNLLAYDIENEEIETIGALPNENWNTPSAIAFDESRGMIYYTMNGSVWRMPVAEDGLGEPEEFGDMPLDIYADATAVLLGDTYILSGYDGVVGRSVTIEQLPEQRLRVDNMSYLEPVKQAYFPFTDAHPEYMVSIANASSTDTVLQDMMNRSADTDIYTMSASSDAFNALFDRGFLAELGSSASISESVNAMYESLQSTVTKDGEIYAVPMSLYSSVQAINKTLLTEKLGYAEADIPKDWPGLFALLADIAATGKLEEFPEVTILSPGYTQRDAKYSFFSTMMESYFLWLEQSEENLMRGSEVLLAACEAFEQVDWAALNLPEEYDYEDESAWAYNPENILLETTSVQPRYYYDAALEPMVLAITDGETPMMGMEVILAFVNPFSTQREAAVEYLEMAFELMDPAELIALMPGKNEPIESPYYEENLAFYDETIADIEAQLEEQQEVDEPDEETIDMLTQNLEDYRSYREEYMLDGRWEVSEEDIERYRQYAQHGVVARATVWSSGAYTQIAQYIDGAITAQQLASELEKTLQMQRLEGM